MLVDQHERNIVQAFQGASKMIPDHCVIPKNPWISDCTLQLIRQRNLMRHEGNYTKMRHYCAKKYEYLPRRINKSTWMKKLGQVDGMQ